jgi:hypothetical protein
MTWPGIAAITATQTEPDRDALLLERLGSAEFSESWPVHLLVLSQQSRSWPLGKSTAPVNIGQH